MPLLQQYLTHRFGANYGDISYIIKVGLDEAFVYLKEHDLNYAEKIFNNLVSEECL